MPKPETVRRIKSYSAASGYVYQYQFQDVKSARRGPLAAIGEIVTTGYVAVARRILLGFEAVQDARAARRAVALRGSARAKALSLPRSEAPSPSAHSNS